MSTQEENQTVALTFYEIRGDRLSNSTTVHAYLNQPFSHAVAKAAKQLGIESEGVGVVTPDGAPVRVREGGREILTRDVVEKHGFSFGLVPSDRLG